MEEKVKVEGKSEIKVRKDLNEMVAVIGFKKPEETNYGSKPARCIVKLFCGETIEFRDKDNLFALLKSYGDDVNQHIVSRSLVEEVKNSKVDVLDEVLDKNDKRPTYFCVKYVMDSGREFRLFPKDKFVGAQIIENYYSKWKNQQKNSQGK